MMGIVNWSFKATTTCQLASSVNRECREEKARAIEVIVFTKDYGEKKLYMSVYVRTFLFCRKQVKINRCESNKKSISRKGSG